MTLKCRQLISCYLTSAIYCHVVCVVLSELSFCVCVFWGFFLLALRPINMLVYLRDGSEGTNSLAATRLKKKKKKKGPPLQLFPPPFHLSNLTTPPCWPSDKGVLHCESSRPGFDSCLYGGSLSGSSHTSDLEMSTPVAIPPGAWQYRVSA